MDDVTRLRDALVAALPSRYFHREDMDNLDVLAALDQLIAAVEARAALTPERLAKALVATTIFAGHAHDCPVWMNRMIELRGERVDLDTCTCWVKDEAPDRARRIRAALPRPEEPRVERCAFVWKSGTPCGKPKRDSRHKHDSSCLTGGEGHITDMLCHPYTPEAR